MADNTTSTVSLLGVTQYEQDSSIDTIDAIADATESLGNNSSLDSVQITNIGIGLLGSSPFSSTSGKLNTNVGFDRIDQSFKMILDTMLEEVPMLPILGSNLHGVLFEPIDDITFDQLQLVITDALGKLEPRAKILETVISDADRDKNTVSIQIEYQLTNTNIVHVFRDTIVTGNGGDIL